MTATEFNKLLMQIKNGDMSALRPIFEEYYRKLVFTAVSVLHDENDGRDAASEAIMRVIRYVETHDTFNIERPGGFMYTIVKNVAYDMIAKNKRLVELDEACDAAYEDSHERGEATAAIAALPPPEREIATMFYVYDMKISAISAELSMPEGTVKWHISRIKKQIKERLK